MTADGPIKVAIADPPYLGKAAVLYDHPEAAEYDRLSGQLRLIERLVDEFPDGWAMSLHTPALRTILPLCPADCRVGAWVKPFASFKKNVRAAYAWEPVIWRGGRKRPDGATTVRDWTACNITLRRGLVGAKPEGFCFWLFELMGLTPDDELVDLFPGTGAVTAAWQRWRRMSVGLFATAEA
jgi:hypothetical protein